MLCLAPNIHILQERFQVVTMAAMKQEYRVPACQTKWPADYLLSARCRLSALSTALLFSGQASSSEGIAEVRHCCLACIVPVHGLDNFERCQWHWVASNDLVGKQGRLQALAWVHEQLLAAS
jgi:hypothetical protein